MSKKQMIIDKEYRNWLGELKTRIRNVQLKAAISVNKELLGFYWELGADIVRKQALTQWGEGFLKQLSADLMTEFPGMKGFSASNLKYIKQWYLFYNQPNTIGQQLVGQFSQQLVSQITRIPWGHNIAIISRCKAISEALYYVEQTIRNNWSRSVLVHQIESGLFNREGKAITNFNLTLPKPQSDLARWERTLYATVEEYLAQYSRALRASLENLWEKYDQPLHSILKERDEASRELAGYLKELGYE